MLVNRDPDGVPEITEAMMRQARALGFHPVCVICDEPGAVVGDVTGISFIAIAPFLPRTGDRITLENGRGCEVKRALFKVVKLTDARGGVDAISLVPHVYAVLLPDRKAE